MTEHEMSRTLVKSSPELWAECSDAESLARHMGEPFGEIRITRLEPETTVAWEGERARGTVRLEPSGWGTRVTLTARSAVPGPPPAPATPERPPPHTMATRLMTLWRSRRGALEPSPEPEPVEPKPVTEPTPPVDTALSAALDSLGQAHHRPFSRA